jgi:hypothetical protein
VIPVGLEKEISTDIYEAAEILSQPDDYISNIPRLWPVRGIIVTEIEALHILTGVKAVLIASGGVGGAEGGVRLFLEGSRQVLDDTLSFLENSVFGEPPFFK